MENQWVRILKSYFIVLSNLTWFHGFLTIKPSSTITTQDQQIWKLSHTLAVQALLEPENPRDKKQLSKLLSKPISDKYRERLFKYDDFMQMTAGMSLSKYPIH